MCPHIPFMPGRVQTHTRHILSQLGHTSGSSCLPVHNHSLGVTVACSHPSCHTTAPHPQILLAELQDISQRSSPCVTMPSSYIFLLLLTTIAVCLSKGTGSTPQLKHFTQPVKTSIHTKAYKAFLTCPMFPPTPQTLVNSFSQLT